MDNVSEPRFEDQELICRDCDGTFTFTVGEQKFFHAKGLKNVPKRCRNCRRQNASRKERMESRGMVDEPHTGRR